jgi:hypothetical protein
MIATIRDLLSSYRDISLLSTLTLNRPPAQKSPTMWVVARHVIRGRLLGQV